MPRPWVLATLSTMALATSGVGATRPPAPPTGRVAAAPRAPRAALSPDLARVLRRGVLRVALPRDRSSYLVVRGQVLGLELELMEAFARDLGVRLEVVPLTAIDARYGALASGRVDVIGGRLGVDPRYAGVARWTGAVAASRLVLVQPPTERLPHPTLLAARGSVPGPLPDPGRLYLPIQSLDQARGLPVVVPSAAGWRGLLGTLPADLETVVLDDAETAEAVLERVAAGELGLALVREDLARMEAARRPLRLGPDVGVRVGSRLAFRRDADGLAEAFDAWMDANGELADSLQRRYLGDAEGWIRRAEDPTAVLETGALSPYDALLRRSGDEYGVDWRLLAALSFQESSWRRNARSFAGAVGLMQLMPATAQQVGVHDRLDPAQSIVGGARYLAWLDRTWAERVPDPHTRLPLVLASYNAGLGHVGDARRLAAAAGEDPDDWSAVSRWLLRLQEQEWAEHPLVRHGWCRGSEPVHYVQAVLGRWRHFQAMAPEERTG